VNFLSLHDVTKTFGRVTAVDSISLEVEEGELLCFLGPSGCGKTSLLRLVAGLEEPDTGQILLVDEKADGVEAPIDPAHVAQRARQPCRQFTRAGAGDGTIDGGEQAPLLFARRRAHQLQAGTARGVDEQDQRPDSSLLFQRRPPTDR